MGKRVVYRVISYGEWTRPRMRNFREQCCDCGLDFAAGFGIGRHHGPDRRAP
jgi:hypothetical protein